MADTEDFTAVARVIERSSSLNEMRSRGLVRRLLTQAGLRADDVTAHQLVAVGRTLLGAALEKNGIADPAPVVAQWMDTCVRLDRSRGTSRVTNTVEEVFARMGRGR